jgi:hypothetical protein
VTGKRHRAVGLLPLILLGAACASTRTVRVSSTPAARIYDDSQLCVVCEKTPCRVTISRSTCFFFDSSSGFVTLRAVFDDQASQLVVARTCGLEEEQELRFACEADACEPPPAVYRRIDHAAPCTLASPLEEGTARRLAAQQKASHKEEDRLRHRGGSSAGDAYGELGFAVAVLQLGVGALALAVPDFAYRFSTEGGRSGLVWELPVEWTVAGGSLALGFSAAASYFPGSGQAAGKVDLRFWPVFMAGHRVDLGLAAGAFAGDGAGPRAEARLRFHPFRSELRLLSIFVAQSYERDLRADRHVGQLSVGLEMPITFGPVY